MNTVFLPDRTCKVLFFLLGLVYVAGLFVPLMDNDSAHHANIALHMYLTGDYVNLVDYGKDYLDKPHLHFWLCAFSYKLFGVNTFAYKFPSFLFSIAGTWSTYRLGRLLYDRETGKLAALILASAFAFMLANTDVRMDAILTSCIAFSIWQLVAFLQEQKLVNVAGAALGLGLGFCTKGHIAVFTPAVAGLFYILYQKNWRLFFHWKWLLLLLIFALVISPVVYCYYLQFNLHPEKFVRGRNHIDGVKFILFNQSVERFSGESFGGDAKNDRLFFLHSFLWAFAPWSIIGYIAFFTRLKHFFNRKQEWLTPGVFVTILLVVSFSGFKLPHYLNIVFPSTAVMTAAFIVEKETNAGWKKTLYIVQICMAVILLLLAAVINTWAFPVNRPFVAAGIILLLALVFYFFRSRLYGRLQKAIAISVATMVFSFFWLNCSFYPQLLTYQAGNELAFATRGKIDPENVYLWKATYSSSWNFYTKTTRKEFNDSAFKNGQQPWLLYDSRDEEKIKDSGYTLNPVYSSPDFEITKLDIQFVNPEKRDSRCTRLVLAEIRR